MSVYVSRTGASNGSRVAGGSAVTAAGDNPGSASRTRSCLRRLAMKSRTPAMTTSSGAS